MDGEDVESKSVVVGVVSNMAPDTEMGTSRRDVFPCRTLDGAVSTIRDSFLLTSLLAEVGGGSNLAVAEEGVRVVGNVAAVTGSSRPVIVVDLICTCSGTWPGFTSGRVVRGLCGRSRSQVNQLCLST